MKTVWDRQVGEGEIMDEIELLMTSDDVQQQCINQWVGIVGNDIIHGDSVKDIIKKAKEKYPDKEPLIVKLPSETAMLL